MRCKKCKAKVRKGNKFCRKCGEPVRRRKKWLVMGVLLASVAVAAICIFVQRDLFDSQFSGFVTEKVSDENGQSAAESDDEIERQVDEAVKQVYENAGVDLPTSYDFKGEVLETVPISESKDVYTEGDVRAEIAARGFEPDGVEANYLSDGTFSVDNCMGDDSATHPLYTLYHVTGNDELWMICVVNGSVIAMSATQEEVIVENEFVEVFDGFSNTFIKGIPDGSEMQLRQVNRIDAATLEDLG